MITNYVNILNSDRNKIAVEINNIQKPINTRKPTDIKKDNNKIFVSLKDLGGKKSKKRQIKYKRNTKKSQK